MSVPAEPIPTALGYAFCCNQDVTFGGFVRKLDEAQQECQAVAEGGLSWSETEYGLWEATDPVTQAVYEIDAREY